jgi:Lysozyme like domain
MRTARYTLLCLVLVLSTALIGLGMSTPARADAVGIDLCAEVARNAGFSGDPLVTAIAVAMAESSCDPDATNTNGPTAGCPNGSVDRGLWQINSCYHSEVSAACAFDPQCNADAAYRISSGGSDWTQWSTYNSGAYRQYLDDAAAAVDRLGSMRRGVSGGFGVSWAVGRLDVFGRGGGPQLYHNWFERGVASWPDWQPLGGLASEPVAVSWGTGRLDVFAVDANQRMRHWFFDRDLDSVWHGPQVLGVTTFLGVPAVVAWDSGRLDVFGRDTNNNLRHTFFQRGLTDTWPAWEPSLGANLTSSPVAVSWAPGRLDVFATGSTRLMRHWYFDRATDSTWHGPEGIGTTTFTPTIAAVSWDTGRLDLFGRDTNNEMRHTYFQRGLTDTWPTWENLHGIFQ